MHNSTEKVIKTLKETYNIAEDRMKVFDDADCDYITIGENMFTVYPESECNDLASYIANTISESITNAVNVPTISTAKSVSENNQAADVVAKYQEWVDYDMKHYGKISDETNKKLAEAGFEVVKDDYGDYEVISAVKESLTADEKIKIADKEIEDIVNNIEVKEDYNSRWSFDYDRWKDSLQHSVYGAYNKMLDVSEKYPERINDIKDLAVDFKLLFENLVDELSNHKAGESYSSDFSETTRGWATMSADDYEEEDDIYETDYADDIAQWEKAKGLK